MTISKDKLIYDESDLQSSDQVAANLLASGGKRVTSTELAGGKEALDVAVVNTLAWDEIATTFPSDTTELFTYKNNTVPVQTVLVTYQDNTKKVIVSLQKTRL